MSYKYSQEGQKWQFIVDETKIWVRIIQFWSVWLMLVCLNANKLVFHEIKV